MFCRQSRNASKQSNASEAREIRHTQAMKFTLALYKSKVGARLLLCEFVASTGEMLCPPVGSFPYIEFPAERAEQTRERS
jgi:hypothetical protein